MHDLALELDGGNPGVLNLSNLASAIAQPEAGFAEELLHPTLATQAAAYLFHVCQAQAFSDGNKRTAVLAALTFLQINGNCSRIGEDEIYQLALEIAKGNITKENVSQRLVAKEQE